MAGIKFPFQKGVSNFPATNEDLEKEIIDNVITLLHTEKGSLPMGSNIGVNLYDIVFTNLSEIDKVLLTQRIKTTIIQNEPRMIVTEVDIYERSINEKSVVVIDITFIIDELQQTTSVVL